MGVTKAPFVNFSVSKHFDLAKLPLRLFESHLNVTGAVATPVKYKSDIQQLTCVSKILKNSENNGTEEIGFVTSTPGVILLTRGQRYVRSSHDNDRFSLATGHYQDRAASKVSGVGVTKAISSVPLFSKFFNIIKTHVSY